MYFDSHAHLDDAHFDGDRAAILDDLKNHGVTMVMNVGCDLPSSERSVRLACPLPRSVRLAARARHRRDRAGLSL